MKLHRCVIISKSDEELVKSVQGIQQQTKYIPLWDSSDDVHRVEDSAASVGELVTSLAGIENPQTVFH